MQGEEPYFEMSDNNDWIIKSLGAPIVNSQVINGQTIRELVFKYAMFPQKSGKMTVPAAKFRGFYLTKDTRHLPEDFRLKGIPTKKRPEKGQKIQQKADDIP